eukprot:CAMPEP_0116829118 /NCGR_PEP_ID=MMETSP0418-20121206/4020_1 /TAXON_ID=1158023 /ORGANISM="Astrosyne radiata, Strain 13vi08-1A" /LENGTH=423 /DNA_ID=CAMNT_0004458055 /DNA_START=195 /DNA_END=1467 /DNA_ORIENTATION=+
MSVLAKRLAGLLPDPLQVVYFCNSGSEANDMALRLARAYSGTQNTICVEGAYHGHTIACLEVSPYKYQHSKEFTLASPKKGCEFKTPGKHIWQVPCPNTYRGPYQDMETAGKQYAKSVEEACDYFTKERKERVAAWIVEGGSSVGGVILPPPEYLSRCAQVVRNAGGLYIADEVQTGFGRLGSSYWAFQHSHVPGQAEVVPDIVTVGKPFGNGMPLAAVVTTPKIAQQFCKMGVEYFNTFGGNPVCTAAGLAVLDVIASEGLQKKARVVGGYLKQAFLDLADELDIVGDVRGSGFLLGIELVQNRDTKEPATNETSFLCTILKEKYAILTSIDGTFDNVLTVKPPMVFSETDADYLTKSFRQAVLEDLAAVEDIAKCPERQPSPHFQQKQQMLLQLSAQGSTSASEPSETPAVLAALMVRCQR